VITRKANAFVDPQLLSQTVLKINRQ